MKRALLLFSVLALAPMLATGSEPVLREWNFAHDGNMFTSGSQLSFKKGGRLDARMIRLIGTNAVVLQPRGSSREYWLALTNLVPSERKLVLEAPEHVQTIPGLVSEVRGTLGKGPWLPESLVLTNRNWYYRWDRAPSASTGTLKVESLDTPRLDLAITSCPYDAKLWVVTNEVNPLTGREHQRTLPRSNVTIRAYCYLGGTNFSAKGEIEVIIRRYLCRDQ